MNISIFGSFRTVHFRIFIAMPPTYFMLTRVPGLGRGTLMDAHINTLHQVQKALLPLLAFFDIIHFVPSLVYAKKTRPELIEDLCDVRKLSFTSSEFY
jgi:hypothetical protein